jgi:hypothetical protein
MRALMHAGDVQREGGHGGMHVFMAMIRGFLHALAIVQEEAVMPCSGCGGDAPCFALDHAAIHARCKALAASPAFCVCVCVCVCVLTCTCVCNCGFPCVCVQRTYMKTLSHTHTRTFIYNAYLMLHRGKRSMIGSAPVQRVHTYQHSHMCIWYVHVCVCMYVCVCMKRVC